MGIGHWALVTSIQERLKSIPSPIPRAMAVSEEQTVLKSAHVADEALAPFLQPTFDPADYLNATLPSLSLSSVSSRPLKSGNAVSLALLSTQTQDLVSQL